MKYVAIACALVLFAASTAAAGDLAVPRSTLGSMGLGSMNHLSDNDGLAIRGMGTFAGVSGSSHAKWVVGGGPHGPSAVQESTNNYEAGAQWIGKRSSAGGESFSFAGKVEVQFASDPTGSQLAVHAIGGIAGGSAKAFAR
jgi:hypothetical protein